MRVSIDVEAPLVSSEAEWERWVVAAARLFGWRVAKINAAPNLSDSGVPDLLLARGGRVLFIELKVEGGGTTPEQERWIEELDGAVSMDSMGCATRALVAFPPAWEEVVALLAPTSIRLGEVRAA